MNNRRRGGKDGVEIRRLPGQSPHEVFTRRNLISIATWRRIRQSGLALGLWFRYFSHPFWQPT
jgi:hypothetical protein